VLLTDPEIRRSLERVKAAFPGFAQWDYNNEINESYPGFSLWGEFVPDPKEPMPRSFFITFDTHVATWSGHLSIGKHRYFWSSADCGDAYLVDAGPCATLEDAITSLKQQMADLFAALSGTAAEPEIAPGESPGE
jgi:hypothetical protein